MKILIDGYNLIFECGLHGRRINTHSLANAREILLQTLQTRLSLEDRNETTIVFDAKRHPLSEQQEREMVGLIEVFYSINYSEADELIEILIRQHSSPKQLLMVSSDHRLQKAALRRKANVIDSGDWYDEITADIENPETSERHDNDKSAHRSLLSEDDLAMFKKDIDEEFRMGDGHR